MHKVMQGGIKKVSKYLRTLALNIFVFLSKIK